MPEFQVSTLRDIRATVREVFREEVSVSSEKDRLEILEERHQIQLTYFFPKASRDSRETTHVKLRFHPDRAEMWLGALEVASPYRSRGIGREIAQAVEVIAQRLGIREINLFPLFRSGPFWQKLGYGEHRGRAARVLSKTVVSARSCSHL